MHEFKVRDWKSEENICVGTMFFYVFGLFHLHRIWGFFIALGAFVFCLGVKLLKQRRRSI